MSYVIFWAAEREQRRKAIKDIFVREDAMTPENAIEVTDISGTQRSTLERLIRERVVVEVDGKHYFDTAGEKQFLRRAQRHNWFVVLVLVVITIILFIIFQ